jgi:hypothetical protein
MRATKITIEERILDTEVDNDKLVGLVADTIIEHIAKEIRAGAKSKGHVLECVLADPSLPALKQEDAKYEVNSR